MDMFVLGGITPFAVIAVAPVAYKRLELTLAFWRRARFRIAWDDFGAFPRLRERYRTDPGYRERRKAQQRARYAARKAKATE